MTAPTNAAQVAATLGQLSLDLWRCIEQLEAADLDATEEPEVPIRKRRKAERVFIDGRMVHPDAPHGTSTGYDHWWCRCLPCCGARAARAAQQRQRVAARKEAARGTDR